MDAQRRRWLESIASACERVLANGVRDPAHAEEIAHHRDMSALLARIRIQLDAPAG